MKNLRKKFAEELSKATDQVPLLNLALIGVVIEYAAAPAFFTTQRWEWGIAFWVGAGIGFFALYRGQRGDPYQNLRDRIQKDLNVVNSWESLGER